MVPNRLDRDELLTTRLWLSSCDLRDVDDYVLVSVDWDTESVWLDDLTEMQQWQTDRSGDISQLLKSVAQLAGQDTFRCTSSYRLDRSNWEPIIALPLMRIDIPGTSLQQISGVRFSTARPAAHHSAVLEIVDDDILKIILEFGSKAGPPEEFFNQILLDSNRMRDCIVTRGD